MTEPARIDQVDTIMECGCLIYREADSHDLGIDFCPTHDAAPALLEACEGLLDAIENGGRVIVGAAAKVWKIKTPAAANHDTPGIWWAEADARRQDKDESLGEPW